MSANKLIAQEFPVFFKYFRMNEISMTITYYHEKNSFLNSKDLRVKLAPFISHYKFLPFKRMFDNYEGHCKKVFISQIPNILKQKFLKAKQKVDEVTNVGVTNSLMQGVTRVRDLAVGHVGVAQKLKKKKDRKERKKKKKKDNADGAGGTNPAATTASGVAGTGGETTGNSSLEGSGGAAGSLPNQEMNESDSEYESEEGSDSDASLDDEAKKANEQYLEEIKVTKLREARKILFGDFVVL
jgi:hypothetical protein